MSVASPYCVKEGLDNLRRAFAAKGGLFPPFEIFLFSSYRRLRLLRFNDVGKDDVDFISCKKNYKHKWESECVARMPFRSD